MSLLRQKCGLCSGQKNTRARGSITQWLFSCTCNEEDSNTGLSPHLDLFSEDVVLCAVCQKHMNQSRPGSFSQWIFKRDLCRCTLASPVSRGNVSWFPHDRYEPGELIGRGSSSFVYSATDIQLEREVAVKVIANCTEDDSYLCGIQEEARILSRMSHDNIVSILDVGLVESRYPYIVMELVKGQSLARLIHSRKRMRLETMLDIFVQVCQGLAYCHERGIIHGDIKSENIIVDQRLTGALRAQILDFGFGVSEGMVSVGTESGDIAGSSPSKGLGFDREISSVSRERDVYALGWLLHELLYGNRQKTSDVDPVYESSGNRSLLPGSTAHGELIPSDLVKLCTRLLDKESLERPAIKETLALSTRFLNDVGSSAQRTADPLDLLCQQSADNFGKRPRLLRLRPCLAGLLLVFLVTISLHLVSRPVHGSPPVQLSSHVQFGNSPVIEDVVDLSDTMFEKDNRPLFPLSDAEGLFVKTKARSGFDLTKYRVTDTALEKISRMKVDFLLLMRPDISNTGLEYLSRLSSLKLLRLRETGSSHRLDFRKLAALDNLIELDLSYTSVDDQTIDVIKDLPKLRKLNLKGCRNISGKCISTIARVGSLENLVLSKTKLTADEIARLDTLPNLVCIELSGPQISDTNASIIGRLSRLKSIKACNSKISIVGISRLLASNPSLELLKMRECYSLDERSIAQSHGVASDCKIVLKNPW